MHIDTITLANNLAFSIKKGNYHDFLVMCLRGILTHAFGDVYNNIEAALCVLITKNIQDFQK